jgi:aminopeptidase YwaD
MGVPAFFIYAMGPRKAYHDVDDVPGTLTFAGYEGIYRLISRFMTQLP